MTAKDPGPARAAFYSLAGRGERSGKAYSAYLAFIAALMLTVINAHQSIAHAAVIIGLLATSLPAIVALIFLDSIVWIGQEREGSISRLFVRAFAFAFSLSGFGITIWSFSRLAVIAILLQIPVWFLVVDIVSYLGARPDAKV